MLGSIIDAICFFWPNGKKEKTVYLEDANLLMDKELSTRLESKFGDIKIEERLTPLFNLIGAVREDKKNKGDNKKEFSISIINHLGEITFKKPKHRYSLVIVVNSYGQIFILKIDAETRYGRKINTISDVSLLGKYKVWDSRELLHGLSKPPVQMDLEIVGENGYFMVSHSIRFFYTRLVNIEDTDKEKGIAQESISIKEFELRELDYVFKKYSMKYKTRQKHTIEKEEDDVKENI